MSFDGFPPGALDFFDRLAANKNRDWFQAHKAEYERLLRTPMIALVADLASRLAERGVPLTVADPAKAIMRINRDVRFAKDKSPYKTNIAATLTRTGERHAPGMLYLHVSPEGSFAGCGFYEIEPTELDAFRRRIVASPSRWSAIETALESAGTPLSHEIALTRSPKGYEGAPPSIADALRLKVFVTKLWLDPSAIARPELPERLADFAQTNAPLLEFGWSALEGADVIRAP
jgi:uncharacterized protein (TIGR02453 family)